MTIQERRQSPRAPYYAELAIVGKSEYYYHRARNLSLGGVFLCSEFPLAIGTRVLLSLPCSGEPEPLILPCMVAWTQAPLRPPATQAGTYAEPEVQRPPGMGMAFLEVTPEARLRLQSLIGEYNRLEEPE